MMMLLLLLALWAVHLSPACAGPTEGYGYGGRLEALRRPGGDVGHLDEGGHVFLDYAGTGVYRKSQVEASAKAKTPLSHQPS